MAALTTDNVVTEDDLTELGSIAGSTIPVFLEDKLYKVPAEQFRGEKGKQGDAFTYEDFTAEQLEALKEGVTTINKRKSQVVDIATDTSSIAIDIAGYNHGSDMLDVYINGLKLIENVDYTNDGATITFTKPLTLIGQVHIVVTQSIAATEADVADFITAADVDSAMSSTSENPVQNKVVLEEIQRRREVFVGEIYNQAGYYKLEVIGYYARPLEFTVKTSKGGYERFSFGQDVTPRRLSEGGQVSSSFKYIAPASSGTTGTLLIYSSKNDIALDIFYTSNYSKGNSVSITSATEEEWNGGTEFTNVITLRDFTTKTEVANTYATKTELASPLPWRHNYMMSGYSYLLKYRKIGNGSMSYTDNANWSFYSEIEVLYHDSSNIFERGVLFLYARGQGSTINPSVKLEIKDGAVSNLSKFKIDYMVDTTNKKIYFEILACVHVDWTNFLFRENLTRISDMLISQSSIWTWNANGSYKQSEATMQSGVTEGYTEIPLSVVSVDKNGKDIAATYSTKTETEALEAEIANLKALISSYSTGVMPVSACYTQYPDESEPAAIFGGTWTCFSSGDEPIKIWKRTE